MKINLEAPFNSLSFGQVSTAILRELLEKGVEVYLWPIGRKADFFTFDLDEDTEKKIEKAYNNRFKGLDPNIPTLKIWHLNGSESSVGCGDKYLYTAYEADMPTPEELAVCKNYKKVIFPSHESAKTFKDYGANNIECVPLGFDRFCLHNIEKEYFPKEIIHWCLFGKFEKRKQTENIIRTWLSKYKNNPNHILSCFVFNPFFTKETMDSVMEQIGESANNISALPYMKKNSEVNDAYNSCDIDLTGLSLAEGFNLPSFNLTALGKWSIVLNHTGHKTWANEKNSILVQPEGKQPIYDNMFFRYGSPFNQGSMYEVSEETMTSAMQEAEKKAKTVNEEGLKLQKDMSFAVTTVKLLNLID